MVTLCDKDVTYKFPIFDYELICTVLLFLCKIFFSCKTVQCASLYIQLSSTNLLVWLPVRRPVRWRVHVLVPCHVHKNVKEVMRPSGRKF